MNKAKGPGLTHFSGETSGRKPRFLLAVLFVAFIPATSSLFLYSFAILPTARDWGLSPFGAAAAGFLPMALSPLGGILFGSLSDRFGRRGALFSSILLSASSALLSGTSAGPFDMGIYRLLLGIGIRGQWAVTMTLVGEIWPPDDRGKAGRGFIVPDLDLQPCATQPGARATIVRP